METEIWKDIPWYEWLYQASTLWNIKSLYDWNRKLFRERIMKLGKSEFGYLHITLWPLRKNFLVHRLIAITFIKNESNKPQVNHKNWIKSDNTIENLEWCTWSENIIHSLKNWLSKNNSLWKFWKDNKLSKSITQYSMEWNFIKKWYSIMDIKRELWFNTWWISKCCYWKYKKSNWFIWNFS